MNAIKDYRLGRFEILQPTVMKYPELVVALLNNVLITRCEFMFHKLSFEYHGYSEMFEQIERGAAIPTYGIHTYLESSMGEDDVESVYPVQLTFNSDANNTEAVRETCAS